jgi:hypothetical protein
VAPQGIPQNASILFSEGFFDQSDFSILRNNFMWLFRLGLFTIAFDNLFFAPSRGWATISPLIFFIYVIVNYRKVKITRNLLIAILFCILYQTIILFVNEIHMLALVDEIQAIVLGMSFYFALKVRYDDKLPFVGALMNDDAKYIYYGYLFGFIYGATWLISNKYYLGLSEVFQIVEKRYYNRLSFSFTEPSFITLHVYGVLWLFLYLVHDSKLRIKIILLGLGYLLLTIFNGSSGRAIIDTLVFLMLIYIKVIFNSQKSVYSKLVISTFVSSMCIFILSTSQRINSIINSGIYTDISGATRWLFIYASMIGYVNRPLKALFGCGIGNVVIFSHIGFDRAFTANGNYYTPEVFSLISADFVTSLYCMPIKIISEWGLILFLFIIIHIIRIFIKSKIDIFVVIMTFYLYTQFDSYAFYSIYLLIFISLYYKPEGMGLSYFDSCIKLIKQVNLKKLLDIDI